MNPRQRVDPFIPLRPAQKHKPLAGQYGTQWLRTPDPVATPANSAAAFRPAHPTPPRSTEGISHAHVRQVRPTPQQPARQPHTSYFPKSNIVSDIRPARPAVKHYEPTPPPAPRASQPVSSTSTHTAAETIPQKKRPRIFVRLLQKTQLLGFLLVAIIIGLFAQSLVFGELAIGVYAIFALTRRITSQTTFLLALIALVGIIVLLTVNANSAMADNFAVYAFLLLTVGTVSLGFEIRRGA